MSPQALTSILIPVGFESSDGNIIAGKDGYIFLYRGSNDLLSQYSDEPHGPKVSRLVSAWASLLWERVEFFSRQGIAFYQMIIPEKSTILHEYAPQGLGPITPVLRSMDTALLSGSLRIPYDSLVSVLRPKNRYDIPPFARTDSHLTSYSAMVVVQTFLRFLALEKPAAARKIGTILDSLHALGPSHPPSVFSGDIGARLLGFPIYEKLRDLDTSGIQRSMMELHQDYKIRPSDDAHVGTTIVWQNPQAPLEMKAVAFGNSFFERGGSPRGLSWWFKYLFREFHFVWSPRISTGYVVENRPEVVICQTIERFLPNVPHQ